MCEKHRHIARETPLTTGKPATLEAKGGRRVKKKESKGAGENALEVSGGSELESVVSGDVGVQRKRIRQLLHELVAEFDVIKESPRVNLSDWKISAHSDYATALGLPVGATLEDLKGRMSELGFGEGDLTYLLGPIQSS